MALKRHQILHKNGRHTTPVDMEWVDEQMAQFAETAAGRDTLHPHFGRSHQVGWSLFMALNEHLGKGPIDNLASRLNFGMDCAVAYYLDDWFVPDDQHHSKVSSGCATVGHALFLAGMTQRWDDLEKIRVWYAANFPLEPPNENFTPADYFNYHFPMCVLSSLGPEPIPGVPDIVAAGMAGTGYSFERVQPMWRAWEAVLANDQKAFNKEFPAAVRIYLKGDGFDDAPNPVYSVAVDASYIWLLAERKGLKLPKLTEKQEAAVARRETVGLVEGVDPRPKSPDGTIEPDTPPKRYEILGNKLYAPIEHLLGVFDREFTALQENIVPGQPHQHLRRESNLNCCVQLAILEHLGYGPIEGLADRLSYGMDWAVEYFFGDWYRDDEAQRDYARVVPEPRQLYLARTPFWQSLLLGGLTGRWADVERIAGWYNAHVDLASQGPLLESHIDPNAIALLLVQQLESVRGMQLQLAVASGLAPSPIPGVEELVARVKGDEKSLVKPQALLCALWGTVLAKDQAAFDKSLSDKTRHFLDNRGKPTDLRAGVDLYASAMWLVAERNGLVLPTLTPFKDAVLVRRQTIGLA